MLEAVSAMPARILLIDDDPVLLEVLSDILRFRLGALVETCESALAALERLSTDTYDVIISDLKMPRMDGLIFVANLQEIQPHIPTILITEHGDDRLAEHARSAGAYALVGKPIDREQFVGLLKEVLQTTSARRHDSLVRPAKRTPEGQHQGTG
jgi:DNA-binding NtrC family response regulator